MSRHFKHTYQSLFACLTLTVGIAAQDARKVAIPPPPVDVDLHIAPRIAKNDGSLPSASQFWPVTWQRWDGRQYDIYGARVQWDGTLATAPFAIETSVLDNDTEPVPSSLTDTINGARYFLVAYTTNQTGNLDVYLRAFRDGATPVNVAAGYLANLERLLPGQRARNQYLPQVDSDGSRFAVSYMERYSTTDRDVYVSTIDLSPSLRAVDPRVPLTIATLDTNEVGIAASRGSNRSDYCTAWNVRTPGTTTTSIEAAIYVGATPGGGFSTRATACGGFAISYAAGSQTPTPGAILLFDLSGAPGPTLFIVGEPIAETPLCSPESCALGATLTVLMPGPTLVLTIPRGPGLVGTTLAVQGAALISPGGCADLGELVMSDTVDVTIR